MPALPRLSVSLAGTLAGALAVLSGCSLFPRPVDGVPASPPWFALPLRTWLAEDRAEPEALAICRKPDCAPEMAVTAVRLTGAAADRAEADLLNPANLARTLNRHRPNSTRPPVVATARPADSGESRGFTLQLSRRDGDRPAYGAAFGRRDGGDLRVVMAIGEDEQAVTATARAAALAHLRR